MHVQVPVLGLGLGGYGGLGSYGLGGYGAGLQIVQQVPVLPVAAGALALNYGGIGGYGGLGQSGYGALGAGGLGVGGLGLGVGGLGYGVGGLGVGNLGVGGLGVGGLGGLYRREGRDLLKGADEVRIISAVSGFPLNFFLSMSTMSSLCLRMAKLTFPCLVVKQKGTNIQTSLGRTTAMVIYPERKRRQNTQISLENVLMPFQPSLGCSFYLKSCFLPLDPKLSASASRVEQM